MIQYKMSEGYKVYQNKMHLIDYLYDLYPHIIYMSHRVIKHEFIRDKKKLAIL